MRYLLCLIFILMLSGRTHAESPAHWSVKIESREAVLSDGKYKWFFSGVVNFAAARDQLFFASTKDERFNSQLIQNEKIRLPSVLFQRLLRLWKEAPLKSKVENAFTSWSAQSDYTEVHIRRALKRTSLSPKAYPAVDQLWLGCYDGPELCLGFNEDLSNPNLLANTIEKDELTGLNAADLKDFKSRTAHLKQSDLEEIFVRALVPRELAQLYALKLMSRRATILKEANPFASSLNSFHVEGLIHGGVLYKSPAGVEVDFKYDHLEAKVRDFVSTQYKNVEDMARYLLAHFPYMAYEYDKGLGGYSVGPGFMFRIKRKVIKNPHSDSPENLFRINDSVEIWVTLNVGIHRSVGVASGSVGAAPGYVTKYHFSSFAASREAASKSPWTLTKEVVLGTALDQLKPRQSFTSESGWSLGGVASGHIRVLGQNRVRPQANIAGSYRFLKRHYVYVEDNNTALVGFGDSHGYDLSSQAFIKVVARLAKIPVFTWSSSSLAQTGGVYRVPMNKLVERGYIEDEEAYREKYTSVNYNADYQNKYLHFNIWFYRTTQTYWNGFVNFEPTDLSKHEEGFPDKARRFYLLENSKDSAIKFSLGHDPQDQNCAAWAAFEADDQNKTHFVDASFKMTCVQNHNASRPLTAFQLENISAMLNLGLNKNVNNVIPKKGDSAQMELSWDIKLSWRDLSPLFAEEPTGWLQELVEEIKALRRQTDNSSFTNIDEVQERFAFVMTLNHILSRKTEEARAKAFFEWMTDSASKETFIKILLKRVKHGAVSLQIFRPLANDHSLVEQTYSYGEAPNTESFRLVEEKNKWIGSN